MLQSTTISSFFKSLRTQARVMRRTLSHGLLIGAAVSLTGCATTGKSDDASAQMTQPNPMEHNFGHVLFNDSAQHFPTLKPAAPADTRTPSHTGRTEDPVADAEPNDPTATDVARADVRPPPRTERRPLRVPPRSDAAPAPRPQPRTDVAKTVPDAPKKPRAPKKTDDRGLTIEPARPAEAPAPAPKPDGLGDGTRRGEVLAAARRLVGRDTHFDEQGFLIHLLQVADVQLDGAEGDDIVKTLYDDLNERNQVFGPSRTPKPGDIIFFSNTYDRDEDGRSDDWFTMAGVVERLDGDGTVQFIGFAGGRIDRYYMNLQRPSAERNETTGKTLNSLLREKKLSDRPFTTYHAGELFASYGSLDR